VHHTTIDDIPKGEPVIAGMVSINNHPAVILFDSGSSHSFISQTLIIADRQYKLNLIVMPELVLDVIMGMNWMNKMGVVIDIGGRIISIKEPAGEGTFQVVLLGG
jgi:hypothetical protein